MASDAVLIENRLNLFFVTDALISAAAKENGEGEKQESNVTHGPPLRESFRYDQEMTKASRSQPEEEASREHDLSTKKLPLIVTKIKRAAFSQRDENCEPSKCSNSKVSIEKNKRDEFLARMTTVHGTNHLTFIKNKTIYNLATEGRTRIVHNIEGPLPVLPAEERIPKNESEKIP